MKRELWRTGRMKGNKTVGIRGKWGKGERKEREKYEERMTA